MLDARLLLAAWTPARPIHNGFHKGGAVGDRSPFVEAAEGGLPSWTGLAGVQASRSKQASGIKQQVSSSKQQALINQTCRELAEKIINSEKQFESQKAKNTTQKNT